MRGLEKVKIMALAVTILALAAGSVMAQERSERQERQERRERVRALRSAVVGPGQVAVRSIRRAGLGVYPDTDQDEATDARGARIRGVLSGGPADEAGLREGDIIVSLNGRSVLDPLPDPLDEDDLDSNRSLPVQRLVATARKLESGDEVEVVYLREGERRTATLTAGDVGMGRLRAGPFPDRIEGHLRRFMRDGPLGPRPRELLRRHEGERPGVYRFFGGERPPGMIGSRSGHLGRCPGGEGGWAVLMNGCVAGVRLVPLNPRLGRYFESDEGVLVADVAQESGLGLEPGDVILSIDGREVDEPRDVTRILRSYREGEEVTLRIVRQGDRRTVEGTIE